MAKLPPFTADGLLPPGEYELNFKELRESMLVVGPGTAYPNWDAHWRRQLVDNLSILVRQLWEVGITQIFIGGSFVEDVDHPNDIDGYFVCELVSFTTGKLQRKLNRLDPYQIWTGEPSALQPDEKFSQKKLPMWHRYRVELYPDYGQGSGLLGERGRELSFAEAFRLSKKGSQPRGIVKVRRGP